MYRLYPIRRCLPRLPCARMFRDIFSMSTHNRQEKKPVWHHTLHPSVTRGFEGSAFSGWLGRRLHPTAATLTLREQPGHVFTEDHPCTSYKKAGDLGVKQQWTSRHNRKHRYVCASRGRTEPTRHATNVLVALWHMTRIEYWNVSWWVAQAFTWGSVVWCLNGFFALMPLLYPSTFADSLDGTGWTACVGATIFEIGSIFGMWEAWNRDDRASFGWNVRWTRQRLENRLENIASRTLDEMRPTLENLGSHFAHVSHPETTHITATPQPHERWVWFSTDPKYLREVGFLAAFFQFMGATVFWISGITALPAIQRSIQKHTGVLSGVFWVPQVVGGMGFVVSSTFIMLETQSKWYRPKPLDVGWQVGFWNFIGGVGFTACGALGLGAASNSGLDLQSALCTFWGSWAFLIGSIAQWYESVNCV